MIYTCNICSQQYKRVGWMKRHMILCQERHGDFLRIFGIREV